MKERPRPYKERQSFKFTEIEPGSPAHQYMADLVAGKVDPSSKPPETPEGLYPGIYQNEIGVFSLIHEHLLDIPSPFSEEICQLLPNIQVDINGKRYRWDAFQSVPGHEVVSSDPRYNQSFNYLLIPVGGK
jgi:hypothetical protein